MLTAEPNVGMHASNLVLVRIGAQVGTDRVAAIKEAVHVPPWLRERRAA